MAKINGICKNYDECDKAQNKEIQEIEKSAPFVCEECQKPLNPVNNKGGKNNGPNTGPNKILIGIIAAVVLIGAGIAAFFLLKDSSIPISSLVLNTTNLELKEEDTQSINLKILPENATVKTVQWASGNDSVAKVTNGIVTALKPGNTTVTVTTTDGSNVSATCNIKVTQKEPEFEPVLVSSISLKKTGLTLKENTSETLELTILPEDASNKSVEWSSSDPSIVTVDENGTVTAIKKGDVKITAKVKDESELSAACVVKVTKGEGSDPKNLGYATWSGKLKNGLPHDTQGTLTFKTRHIIDSRDEKKRVADAGDKVIGEFENGHLVQGRWYKKDGNVESIIIGM